VASPDLDKVGQFITALAGAGVLSPNRELENKLLEMGNLPTPDDDDMSIFDDPKKPTPAASADMATGLLSDRQIDAILRINQAINAGQMSRAAAARTMAAALGVDEATALGYIETEYRDAGTSPQVVQE
jgi:hypothetical protein